MPASRPRLRLCDCSSSARLVLDVGRHSGGMTAAATVWSCGRSLRALERAAWPYDGTESPTCVACLCASVCRRTAVRLLQVPQETQDHERKCSQTVGAPDPRRCAVAVKAVTVTAAAVAAVTVTAAAVDPPLNPPPTESRRPLLPPVSWLGLPWCFSLGSPFVSVWLPPTSRFPSDPPRTRTRTRTLRPSPRRPAVPARAHAAHRTP